MKKVNPLPTAPDPDSVIKAHSSTLQKATDFKAETLEDYVHGGSLLKMLTAAEKEYKAKEDTALIPAKAAVDAIKKLFDSGRSKLAACKAHIKDEMGEYTKRTLAQAAEQERKILADKRTSAATKAAKLELSAPVLPTTNTRKVRTLKVTNKMCIPWEFLEVNESKLKDWLMEGNTCEGAHLVNETIIVS